jgi:hypothetical protein
VRKSILAWEGDQLPFAELDDADERAREGAEVARRLDDERQAVEKLLGEYGELCTTRVQGLQSALTNMKNATRSTFGGRDDLAADAAADALGADALGDELGLPPDDRGARMLR